MRKKTIGWLLLLAVVVPCMPALSEAMKADTEYYGHTTWDEYPDDPSDEIALLYKGELADDSDRIVTVYTQLGHRMLSLRLPEDMEGTAADYYGKSIRFSLLEDLPIQSDTSNENFLTPHNALTMTVIGDLIIGDIVTVDDGFIEVSETQGEFEGRILRINIDHDTPITDVLTDGRPVIITYDDESKTALEVRYGNG